MAEVVSPKLTKEQYQLLLWYEQEYNRNPAAGLPDYNRVTQVFGIDLSRELYDKCWGNERWVDSLRSRGVPEHLLEELLLDGTDKQGFRVLTEQQMAVANVMLDVMDKRSKLKKLTEMGVSTAQYNNWMRDPIYRKYCLDRAEDLLVQAQSTAHMSLINRVEQGDLTAIKYYNSLTGRFREKADAAVQVNQVNVNNAILDKDVLIRVVEIIQKHVKDTATLDAIAQDILALTGINAPKHVMAIESLGV